MDITHISSQLRQLVLDIDNESISFMVHGGSEPVDAGTIKLDKGDGDFIKALENGVYDHAMLLEEYGSVKIVVHSPHFVVMPQELVDGAMAEKVLAASFTRVDGAVLTSSIARSGVAVACDYPRDVLGFLQRTYVGASIMHHLVPLCSYCLEAHNEDTGCEHIFITPAEAHIVAMKQGHLQLANTFTYRSIEDVVYYALNVWKASDLDSRRDKVLLSGDNALCRALAEHLREWISYVMPEVAPTLALKLGKDAITMPFNLLALALYENN